MNVQKLFKELNNNIVIFFIRMYQWCIHPVLDALIVGVFGVTSKCKYQEHCSDYMIRQVRKHGTMRGLLLGITRILSCHR